MRTFALVLALSVGATSLAAGAQQAQGPAPALASQDDKVVRVPRTEEFERVPRRLQEITSRELDAFLVDLEQRKAYSSRNDGRDVPYLNVWIARAKNEVRRRVRDAGGFGFGKVPPTR